MKDNIVEKLRRQAQAKLNKNKQSVEEQKKVIEKPKTVKKKLKEQDIIKDKKISFTTSKPVSNILNPSKDEFNFKIVSESHNSTDFTLEDLKVFSDTKQSPIVLMDEYEIACSCDYGKNAGKFVSRYDCDRCNPLKQEQREEKRRELTQQIKQAQSKLDELEAVDGIKVDTNTNKQPKQRTFKSLIDKMMGFEEEEN